VACQLDSSGSSLRHTDVTTVPATAMLTVRDSEIAKQRVFPEFETVSAHYYRQYYTCPSKHCAVAVWPGADIRPGQTSGVLLSVS